MAISFNGTTLATNIDAVRFNGTAVSKVVFNGTTVWEKISATFTTTDKAVNSTGYACYNFEASGNTFKINGSSLVVYTAGTGFTGSTGGYCTRLGGDINNTIITSSGLLRTSSHSTGTGVSYDPTTKKFTGSSQGVNFSREFFLKTTNGDFFGEINTDTGSNKGKTNTLKGV